MATSRTRNTTTKVHASDDVARQIDRQIEENLCTPRGLKLAKTDFVLVVHNFEAHDGVVHNELRIPVRVRVGVGVDIAGRGTVAVREGRALVRVNPDKAEKEIVEVGGLRYIPRTSDFFNTYKSTLVHELTHACDILTGVSRFRPQDMKPLYPDPDEYRVRYRTSDVEVRAYTRQLLWLLAQKLEDRVQQIHSMSRPASSSSDNLNAYLTAEPEKLLQHLREKKIVPLKLRNWLDTIQQHAPEAYQKVLSSLGNLQASLRARYQYTLYSGA